MGEHHRPLTDQDDRPAASRIVTAPILQIPQKKKVLPDLPRQIAAKPLPAPAKIEAPANPAPAAVAKVDENRGDTKGRLKQLLMNMASEEGIFPRDKKQQKYAWVAKSLVELSTYLGGEPLHADTLAVNGSARARVTQSIASRLRNLFKDDLKSMKKPTFLGL